MSSIDLRMASLGNRLGLPDVATKTAIRARRILAHPWLYWRRRTVPLSLRQSDWFDFIDREDGFRLFDGADLPGVDQVVVACNRAFEATGGLNSTENAKKPFFTNILRDEDLDRYPALMRFALSEPVLAAVSGYLGALPRLKGLGLYYSPANETTRSSQLFHCDHDDFRQMKCFINVMPVTEANGPFTFLSKPDSDRVFAAVGARYHKGRFRDEDVLSQVGWDDCRRLLGLPGHGAFVDTSNCLHFGSRARAGARLAFMFQYTTFPDIRLDKGKTLDGLPLHRFPVDRFAGNDLERLVLSPERDF